MTLQYIIDNVDKSSKDEWFSAEFTLAREFNFPDFELNTNGESRLHGYYFAPWLCTDTWVGGKVYCLDDKPVCISMQIGRKMNESFEWISKELYLETYNYIKSLIPDAIIPEPDIVDLTEEMGEGYKVEYATQLLTKEVIVEGKLMTVTDTFGKEFVSTKVEVKGYRSKGIVHMCDVLVPYRLKSNK